MEELGVVEWMDLYFWATVVITFRDFVCSTTSTNNLRADIDEFEFPSRGVVQDITTSPCGPTVTICIRHCYFPL